jgi:hypothetical protein
MIALVETYKDFSEKEGSEYSMQDGFAKVIWTYESCRRILKQGLDSFCQSWLPRKKKPTQINQN